MPSTIAYSVHSYIDEWLETDRHARRALMDGKACEKAEALKQLGRFLRTYGIGRNFPSAKGGSQDALLALFERAELKADVNQTYIALFRELEQKYEKKLWSATSKLLWLKFGSPFRLYDQYADRWLRGAGYETSSDEMTWYGGFCESWDKAFNQYREEIRRKCREVSNVKELFIRNSGDERELESVLKEDWFHERVFDHFISWPEDQSES